MLSVEKCQNLLSVKHQQRIRNGNDVFREKSYSYTDLLKLVDSIPQLNFMCSEIEQILEFKTKLRILTRLVGYYCPRKTNLFKNLMT